jgi:transcriptional regulator with XRE-family HTH domain
MSRARKSADEIEEAMLLGKALAALRVSRGITQAQVAEEAGSPRSGFAGPSGVATIPDTSPSSAS